MSDERDRSHDLDHGTYRFSPSADHTWPSFEERRLKEMESAYGTNSWKLILDVIEELQLFNKEKAVEEEDPTKARKHAIACMAYKELIMALDADVRTLSDMDRRRREETRREADLSKLDGLRSAGRDRYTGVLPESHLQHAPY